jgi:ubiquitin-like domain-containing CTD phosphatase 1
VTSLAKEPCEDLEFLPDVVNDLDVDFSADPGAAIAYQKDQRNRRKIKEVTEKLTLNLMNPLREGFVHPRRPATRR